MKSILLAVGALLALPATSHEINSTTHSSEQGYAAAHTVEVDANVVRRAAYSGDIQAQHELGRRFLRGDGVEINPFDAYVWSEVAAQRGSMSARSTAQRAAQALSSKKRKRASRYAGWLASQYGPIQRTIQPIGSDTTRDRVALVQRELAVLGYTPGPVDGVLGLQTREAIRRYQQANALVVDGAVSAPLVQQLQTHAQYAVAPTADHPPVPVSQKASVRAVQQALATLGYAPGPIDGQVGARTRAAIRAYQRDFDLQRDGTVSISLMDHLRERIFVQSDVRTARR